MYILLCCWLILTNKHYLLALVTNDLRIIIIKINREIFAKYWVNLKQLMRNSEILWRKGKKINTKKKSPILMMALFPFHSVYNAIFSFIKRLNNEKCIMNLLITHRHHQWHDSPMWVLAFLRSPRHSSATLLQFLIPKFPMYCRIQSSYLNLGLPTFLVPSGIVLHVVFTVLWHLHVRPTPASWS